MKIKLNNFKVSKNALANFNLDMENGVVINNIELIEANGMVFLTKQHSYQAKKENANKGIKVGDYVNVTDVYFSKEVQAPIITAVKAAVAATQTEPVVQA